MDWHRNIFGGSQMSGVIMCYGALAVTSAHGGLILNYELYNNMVVYCNGV